MTPPSRPAPAPSREAGEPEAVEVPPFEYEVRSSGGATNLILRCAACEGPDAIADPRCLAAVLQALGEEYHVDLLTLSGRTMRQYSGETVLLLRRILELHKLLQQLSTRPPLPVLDGIVVPGADLEELLDDLDRQAEIEAARAPVDEVDAEEEAEEDLRRVLGPGRRQSPPAPPPVQVGAPAGSSSSSDRAPAGASSPSGAGSPLGTGSLAGGSSPGAHPPTLPSPGGPPPRPATGGSLTTPAPGRTGPSSKERELTPDEKIDYIEQNKGNLVRRLKRVDCATCAFNPRAFFPDLEESLRRGWDDFLSDLREKVRVLGTGRPEPECVRCLGVTVSDLELVSQELNELVSRVRSAGSGRSRGRPAASGESGPSAPGAPGG